MHTLLCECPQLLSGLDAVSTQLFLHLYVPDTHMERRQDSRVLEARDVVDLGAEALNVVPQAFILSLLHAMQIIDRSRVLVSSLESPQVLIAQIRPGLN